MPPDLESRIDACARDVVDSLGQTYRGLTLQDTAAIAAAAGCTKKAVEIAALRSGAIPCRYWRNIPALGVEGQIRLLNSQAAVVGAGGLGGYVVEILARLGVGTLVVIDGESFAEDNLNRQLFCRERDLGRMKAAVAAERAGEVNSAVTAIARAEFLGRRNASRLLAKCDVAIDGLDRINARLVLARAASRLGIPLVHGALGGFLGEVSTLFPGAAGLDLLYGRGKGRKARGAEAVLGTPSPTPAVVGALQAVEVVKVLTGRGTPLQGRLLYLELGKGIFSEIELRPSGSKK